MIRVIGLGSPFGDDRAGWRVIELLTGELASDIDLQALDRPGAALINWMPGVEWLVIVDAVVTTGEPGHVLRIEPAALGGLPGRLSTHALHLAETLELAGALDVLPPRLDIYGITVGEPDMQRLRPVVAGGAATLAAQLRAQLHG